MGGSVIMTDEQINAAIREYTGVEADFLNCRDAQDKAHKIMAFKTCGEKQTAEQWAIWDEYGCQLFKDGRKLWQLTDLQWAEAYLRALGKWEEEA
jgi:hypothetical protein